MEVTSMRTRLIMAVAFAAGTTIALAADHDVGQKGKTFSVSELTIKKGETVVFINDDNVTHNVLSTTQGNDFNLGPQAPGESTPVTFDVAGDVQIICAIHPGMHLALKVTN
jgi:plastocyanin